MRPKQTDHPDSVATNEQQPDPPQSPAEGITESQQSIPKKNPTASQQSVGERLLKIAVALDAKVASVAPDQGWQKRLSLDDLEVTVSMTSDHPASDSDHESLLKILEAYRKIANDKDAAVVNELPEFKQTLELLQEYVNPPDDQPPTD